MSFTLFAEGGAPVSIAEVGPRGPEGQLQLSPQHYWKCFRPGCTTPTTGHSQRDLKNAAIFGAFLYALCWSLCHPDCGVLT